ncbi:MAG: hypothetical protein ACRYGP_13820 [Janthinobacterium lividum]
MSASPADEIAAELWAIRRYAQGIKPGSHIKPHVFAEQILELTARLDRLHTRVRDTFGGTPARLVPGTIKGPTGRRVQVERRRSSATF